MAVSVDTVYKTVLLVLNKEQRGLVTPDEFNKTATQVQLDIFEQYFEDLNQQFRAPQATVDYSNRQYGLEEKISIFKTEGNCVYSAGKFNLPIVDASGNTVIYDGTDPVVSTQVAFYKLGTVIYTPPVGYSIELEKVLKHDFYNLLKSDLTAPSENFPIYLYEGKTSTGVKTITVSPSTITTNIKANFIRKPRNVVWGFSTGSVGQYLYNSFTSTNFELDASEQVNIINRILLYSGIIIKDPNIIQVAAAEIQQSEINKKS